MLATFNPLNSQMETLDDDVDVFLALSSTLKARNAGHLHMKVSQIATQTIVCLSKSILNEDVSASTKNWIEVGSSS